MTTRVLSHLPTRPVAASNGDEPLVVRVAESTDGWADLLRFHGYDGFHRDPRWLHVLEAGLGHRPVPLEAVRGNRVVGVLPLALVKSLLFGRFLVGLPYLNTGGVLTDDPDAAAALVEHAVVLANRYRAKHLELRHESPVDHAELPATLETKVHSRLTLEPTTDRQWDALKSKVRSQVRKGLKNEDLVVEWGGEERLDDFYDVFCENMRDLGSPPFPRALFREILRTFPDEAELAIARLGGKPVGGALLVHGPGTTQVPSASTLRSANHANVNMVLYWHLLARAIERGQGTFDFGRSTIGGGTHKFKQQWGAADVPAVWQYHVRSGDPTAMRRETGKFGLAVRMWKRLPVWATRWIGPSITRGIP